MALTQITPNAIVKKWEYKVFMEAIQRSVLGKLGKAGAVNFTDQFIGEKAKGDEVTVTYVKKLVGKPVFGGTGPGLPYAEAINNQTFKMAINEMRVLVNTPMPFTITNQQSVIDFEKIILPLVTQRYKELLDASLLYQAAGAYPTSITSDGTTYTGSDRLFVTGLNVPTAPTAQSIYRVNGAATDEALTSADTMSLDAIDKAIVTLENRRQPVTRLPGDRLIWIGSPQQGLDLAQNSTAKTPYFAIQTSRFAGGVDTENPLLKNIEDSLQWIGSYKNVDLYTDSRVATGVNSSTSAAIPTVKRSVLFAKDALMFASPFGSSFDNGVPIKLFDQVYDVQAWKASDARFIGGLKKIAWSDSEDNGTFVISSYAAV